MKRLSILFTLLLFVSIGLQAQGQQITGTVVSAEDGSALPGVTVIVKGTTVGAVTDFEGHYEITVPQGSDILVFSFVGMQTQEIAIGTSTVIDVSLKVDAFNMDEVVVIGYGTARREASTGSVSVVKDDELQDIPEISFDKMLTGKVAGVQVTGVSGQPNAATQVRIRGTSSLNAGNEPLYVVDGIPVMSGNQTYFTNTGNALAMINPNDIESITILKDAAAASIYGSRAANGVILITTKSGAQGKSQVSFRGSYGITSLANDNGFDIMTPEQMVDYNRAAAINAGGDPDDPSDPYYYPMSLLEKPMNNWLRESTRFGNIQNYELSVTGGSEKTKHYTSALYSNTQGVFLGVDFKKYQLRSNIDHEISDKLRMGVKINAFHSEANDVAMQAMYYVNPLFAGMFLKPWTPIYNEDGTVNKVIPEWGNTNPIASQLYDEQYELQNRLQGTAYIEYEPIVGLKFKTNNAIEYTDGEGRRYWSAEADSQGEATLQVSNSKYSQITTSNTISYGKYFNDHNVNLLAGFEAINNWYDSYYIWSPDVDPNIPFPTTSTAERDQGDYAESRYTMASFFGILDYNYSNRYYFRASVRTDGSSRFGENYRWGTFYSFGASWNLHNESFMENANWLDAFKIRLSYGVNGNDRIGNYEHWGIYAPVSYNGVSSMAPNQPANPDLTWETNTSYNAGIDFGFLQRFSGTIEYYHRKTTDMLLDIPLSRTTGFTSLRQNIGELQNQGVEALLDVTVFDGPVYWSVGLNIAANRSEILNLGDQDEIIDSRIIHRVGENLYSYYLYDYAGVNPVNGEALWYNADKELTNLYSEANKIIAGSPEPKYLGGFNTEVSWKGISLNLNFEYKIGNQVLVEELHYAASDGYWWDVNQVNVALDYWREPGDLTKTPIPIANNTTNSNGYYNPRWMYNGDYLRVKNVTLSYTLPSSVTQKLKIAQLRIYGSAVNAYTFHSVDFWDPERGVEGAGFGIYPMTKSFVVGLDVTF
jgi:TonB-dependent starch-binding outer membrane protein SusC